MTFDSAVFVNIDLTGIDYVYDSYWYFPIKKINHCIEWVLLNVWVFFFLLSGKSSEDWKKRSRTLAKETTEYALHERLIYVRATSLHFLIFLHFELFHFNINAFEYSFTVSFSLERRLSTSYPHTECFYICNLFKFRSKWSTRRLPSSTNVKQRRWPDNYFLSWLIWWYSCFLLWITQVQNAAMVIISAFVWTGIMARHIAAMERAICLVVIVKAVAVSDSARKSTIGPVLNL